MNVLIHDLKDRSEEVLFKDTQKNTLIISDNGKIHPCICCFGCWIKTPGQCAVKDGYDNIGLLFSKCENLVIISRCFYGSYSPFVHNVMDRSIPYLLPYFETRNGETHHRCRYDNKPVITVHFYGEISEKEKETARKLVHANSVNNHARKAELYFYNNPNDIKGIL